MGLFRQPTLSLTLEVQRLQVTARLEPGGWWHRSVALVMWLPTELPQEPGYPPFPMSVHHQASLSPGTAAVYPHGWSQPCHTPYLLHTTCPQAWLEA